MEKNTVTLPVRLSPVEGGYTEPNVRKEMLHLQAAEAREQALEDWQQGEYGRAQQNLRSVGMSILNAPWADAELREEAADLDLMADRSIEYVASEADRKYMHHRAQWATHSKRKAAGRVSRVKREEGKK